MLCGETQASDKLRAGMHYSTVGDELDVHESATYAKESICKQKHTYSRLVY